MYVPKTAVAAVTGLLLAASSASASAGNALPLHIRQYLPGNATDVKTIVSPTNVTIRYKEPGKEGVCETTPGVNSYSGYIDIAPDMHTFFWFFESRRDPANDPLTLWLNGGPGSDSLIGLFQELGPCNVTANLSTQVNPYSWSEVSNLLFISQPVGTGFSYQTEGVGSLNNFTGEFEYDDQGSEFGRWPVINGTEVDNTELAAVAAYHVLQGFLSALPQLDGKVESKEFNLWTESYGGHYGPAFYKYFYDQNLAIANGSSCGTQLNFNTLGIGNGIIDEATQAPWYPEFALHNSYGIQLYNQTIYDYAKFACYMVNGCLDQIEFCRQADHGTLSGQSLCSEAQSMCRDNVEGMYYSYGDRGVYDIRHPQDDPTPPSYFVDYLNQGWVQDAIGVNLNYTDSNSEIYYAFQQTGDFIYTDFLADLSYLLTAGLRVALYYGDADYICNWLGGQAVSLAVSHPHAPAFRAAGYAPFTVDGAEYGQVRQHGNFSFLRIYEAGHEVPFYQPLAALEMFNRTISGRSVADGSEVVTGDLSTVGALNATHTEPFVALPSETGGYAGAGAVGGKRMMRWPRLGGF